MTPRARGGALLACLLAAASVAVHAQTFRSGVDAVAVDVLVSVRGRPVSGLTASDFTLLDNDVPQPVEALLVEDLPITLLLVLDTSESVAGAPLDQLRAAAEAAATTLRAEDRVGLVTFSDKLRMVVEPPAPVSDLPAALRRVRAGGATALYDAAFAAFLLREQTVGRVLMLVFSDGADTNSNKRSGEVLKRARAEEVMIYAIGLEMDYFDGRRQRRSEPDSNLRKFAKETGGGYFQLRATDELGPTFTRVAQELHSQYVLGFQPSVRDGKTHGLEVRVKQRGMNARARTSYIAANSQPSENQPD